MRLDEVNVGESEAWSLSTLCNEVTVIMKSRKKGDGRPSGLATRHPRNPSASCKEMAPSRRFRRMVLRRPGRPLEPARKHQGSREIDMAQNYRESCEDFEETLTSWPSSGVAPAGHRGGTACRGSSAPGLPLPWSFRLRIDELVSGRCHGLKSRSMLSLHHHLPAILYVARILQCFCNYYSLIQYQ